MKTKLVLASLISSFILILSFNSCQKENSTDTFTEENLQKTAQVDVAADETEDLIEQMFIAQAGSADRTVMDGTEFPFCATVTYIWSGNTIDITLDFGTECELPNGNTVGGFITLLYTFDMDAKSTTINYTYDNFTFNDITLNGEGNIVRVLHNANDNPQSTSTVDITATFSDGSSAHRTGTRIREWIEGFGTGNWTDNVFLVTGNWTTEFSNGDVNSGLVTTALRREATCPFFVSGVVQLTHNNLTGTLDFGDGTCDNTAVFTGPGGNQTIIKLKK